MNFSDLIARVPSIAANAPRDIGTDPNLHSAAPNHSAQPGTIAFYESAKQQYLLPESSPSALILPASETLQAQASLAGIAWVEAALPKLSFAEILEILHPELEDPPGIDPSARIHPSAAIGPHVFIGALAVVGAHCTVGEGSRIHAAAVLHSGVELGENCVVHSGAVLHRGSSLGRGCVVHANAVIGGEGFGFVRSEQGFRKIPQVGVVVLEDQVEIGSNTCVDRPAMGETRIGRGTKIDNLVQVGHGVKIGADCVLASQVGIAGAAILGSNVILGGQVGVADKVRIGDNVVAYAKSAIPGNVHSDEIVAGIPAIPAKLQLRIVAAYKALPEMARSLRKLRQQVSQGSNPSGRTSSRPGF
jgi:UDP-3-O-[3-hydroxymyristoyl] glucosamine N-acyltransferase